MGPWIRVFLVVEGGVGVGVDGGAEVVVVAAETLQGIVEEFIIIERFPRSSEFSSDALHLGKVLVGGEIILASGVEVRAELLDPGLGLDRDMGIESCPDCSRGVEADDVSEHIGRQSIDEPAQNLLIAGDPHLIVGVDDDDLLVVGVLGGANSSGIYKRVITCQRLGRRSPESSSEGGGGHRRRRGGHQIGSWCSRSVNVTAM
jgi:hypothetical protein